MKNVEALRSILEKMTTADTTEAIEFLDAIETELDESTPSEKYEEIVSDRDDWEKRCYDLQE